MSNETITVFSDYVCPFCYLGRTSLARYREERDDPLAVEWHPFDLRAQERGPDGDLELGVDDGKDESYYEHARQNVRRLQDEYGVEMAQDLATDVDSLDAQIASFYVQREHPERWEAFDWAVFDALWQGGRDIGDRDVILELAADADLDPVEIDAAIEDESNRDAITSRFEDAHESGVTGVPTFIYGEHAARGAVPPAQLRRLVESE